MKIVTSVGPNRIERQKQCIQSWLDVGCTITSVQSQGEAEIFKPLFPEVEFVETDLVGNLFRKPKLVRISALLQQAVRQNILILNSDIEVRCTPEVFKERWSTPQFDELKLGIRWDENPVTKEKKLLEWGIDAFLITPAIVRRLVDVGLSMGCPAWDYWIPIVLFDQYNFKITTNKEPELIHEEHPKNWSERDYKIGVSILRKACKLGSKEASLLIREITGRPYVNKRVRKNVSKGH